MKLPNFEYRSPGSIAEAVALLANGAGDAKILSGGQSLLPMMAFRLVSPAMLVDLRRIPGLDQIETDDNVRLGAGVRWASIERDSRLETAHPLLREAVRHIAHYQIRNRGTVGGSLAHADPAAEFPAVALSCDALINVLGPKGERSIEAEEFLIAPLYTSLEDDEIITAVTLRKWSAGRRFGFKEFSRRSGDFAIIGAVVHFNLDPAGLIADPRIVLFGLADRATRLKEAEALLEGKSMDKRVFSELARAAREMVEVHSDANAEADFRRALIETMLFRALNMAASGSNTI